MTAQQLKNSILQLAVQGKLVPQDPNDEPASILLERIRAEKEALIKAKKIKREKNPSVIFRGADNTPYEKIGNETVELEVPFDIPDSWEWVRIKNFCLDIFSGKSPRYIKSPTEYRIVGQAANQQNGLDFQQLKYTDIDFWTEMDEKYFLRKYDVLLNTLGNGTLGRSGIVTEMPFPLLTDGHLFVFRSLNAVTGWYVYAYLQYRKTEIEKAANGSTNQTFLNLSKTMEWLIPVPPIQEQERIVDKYKELLPYVDQYSDAYDKGNVLNSSFPEQLKKSILQWAVQGKLVPQDPSDEAAEALLERIRGEKERLVREGKIKKDKHESVIFRRDNSHYEKCGKNEISIDETIPFSVPLTWHWCYLGNIAFVTKLAGFEYSEYIAPNLSSEGIPLFKGKNVQHGRLVYNFESYIPENLSDELERSQITKRCLLTPYVGSIGNIAIFDGSFKAHLGSNVGKIEILNPANEMLILEEYVLYYLRSPAGYDELTKFKKATAQESISIDAIRNVLIPIPPIEEQQRIVDTIEKLFAMIDTM